MLVRAVGNKKNKGLYSTLLSSSVCFPTSQIRRKSRALIAGYIPFSLLWKRVYMWEHLRLVVLSSSFLQTKCGVFERTGQGFGGIQRSQVRLSLLPLSRPFPWGAIG